MILEWGAEGYVTVEYRRRFKNAKVKNDPAIVDGRGVIGKSSMYKLNNPKYGEAQAIRWVTEAMSQAIVSMDAEWDGPMEKRPLKDCSWATVSPELQAICDDIHAKVVG